MSKSFPKRTQHGFSLIELMIAVAIGLMLMLVISQVLVTNRQTYRVQDGRSQVQESARFVLAILGAEFRMAGYADISPDPASTKVAFTGTPIDGTSGTANASDSITISYDSATDCAGNATAGIAVNVYSVNASNQFQCVGNGTGSTAIVLFDGVEMMKVLYGVDSTTATKSADTYLPAAGTLSWPNVVGVRVCLRLVSSAVQGSLTTAAPTGSKLTQLACPGEANTNINVADKRVRQTLTTTFNLRNRVNITF